MDPLHHLEKNYENIKSPIAFSGVRKVYNYYGGRLSQKDIKDYLSGINSYTLHRKSRITGHNPSFIKYWRQQMQVDLVDVQSLAKYNNDFRYLLNCIDPFSRYGFCEPLKNKKALTVLQGFKKVLQKAKKYPSTVVSDSGSEFINSNFVQFCKQNYIKCYKSYTSTHASFVERYNRTIKNKIYAYMDGVKTQRYIDVLQNIVDSYNNSVHRMIGMTPQNAELSKNHLKVRQKMQQYYNKFPQRKPKYKIGDTVRISALPTKFHRGFEIQNKSEVFVIKEINSKLPIPLYKLHTYGDSNEIIKGSFYEHELTLTKIKEFDIESILQKTRNKVLVKWVDYERPTWEPRKYIESVLKN